MDCCCWRFLKPHVPLLKTVASLAFALLDIGMDIWACVRFYLDGSYALLGVFVLILVGSSVLVHIFSWIFYRDFRQLHRVMPGPRLLTFLHVCQLGIFVRYLEVVEDSLTGRSTPVITHVLCTLRTVEVFSETLPELVLMTAINVRRQHHDPVTVLKDIGKVLGICFSLTTIQHLEDKSNPKNLSESKPASAVSFLWNLLLISARASALALFASELPCFVSAHFLCSWILFLFCIWRSHTDFMNTEVDEWLYRGMMGLSWYFSWFSVFGKMSRCRAHLYHSFILADLSVLCGVWLWKKNPDLPNFNYEHVTACVCIVCAYIVGWVIKLMYEHYTGKRIQKCIEQEHEPKEPAGGDLESEVRDREPEA